MLDFRRLSRHPNVEQILGDEAQTGEWPARGARNFYGRPRPKTASVELWRID
jgi:hypothetical protein